MNETPHNGRVSIVLPGYWAPPPSPVGKTSEQFGFAGKLVDTQEQFGIMERLPNEILGLVFEHLVDYKLQHVGLYSNFIQYSLSRASVNDISNLRLVSRRFHGIAAVLFGKVLSNRDLTLTEDDLDRFLGLMNFYEIAPHVNTLNISADLPCQDACEWLKRLDSRYHCDAIIRPTAEFLVENYTRFLAAYDSFKQANQHIMMLAQILRKLPALKTVRMQPSTTLFRPAWLGLAWGTQELRKLMNLEVRTNRVLEDNYPRNEASVTSTLFIALGATAKRLDTLVFDDPVSNASGWVNPHRFEHRLAPPLPFLKKLSVELWTTLEGSEIMIQALKCCSRLEVLVLYIFDGSSIRTLKMLASQLFLEHLRKFTLCSNYMDAEALIELVSNVASSLRCLTLELDHPLGTEGWLRFFQDPRILKNLDLDTCLIKSVGDGLNATSLKRWDIPLYSLDGICFPSCRLYIHSRSGDYEMWTRYRTNRRSKKILWLPEDLYYTSLKLDECMLTVLS